MIKKQMHPIWRYFNIFQSRDTNEFVLTNGTTEEHKQIFIDQINTSADGNHECLEQHVDCLTYPRFFVPSIVELNIPIGVLR